MSTLIQILRSELRDAEYSEGYAESFLDMAIAMQIRVLREQRGMTQAELAQAIGTAQPAIARLEDVNYGAFTVNTLKKLAHAFHLRLKVSFEEYGSLPAEVGHLTRAELQRVPREQDTALTV